jgi:glycosyltransferase involved in cell wall biosynthesis
MRDIAKYYPDIRWRYVPAERLSSAAQRNQAIELATADVLFRIDDDSLMAPDCAEQVMAIYEADPGKQVAGVSPVHAPAPPDESIRYGPESNGTSRQSAGWIRRLVRWALRADDIFEPYDEAFPDRPIPEAVQQMPVARIRVMHGARMTFRRQYIAEEGFEDLLERYSPGEDSDASYRVSRHGCLLNATEARLYHLTEPGGRLPEAEKVALGALNAAVLHRLHSDDPLRSFLRQRRLLRRRIMIGAVKDVTHRCWAFPNVRGIWLAKRSLRDVFKSNAEDLRLWYYKFQNQLLENA